MISLLTFHPGLNQTFEGLKWILACLIESILYIVWIRPLRDWNYFSLWFYYLLIAVWIRPLRDWNCIMIQWWVILSWVWIRPLRDWNDPSTSGCSIEYFCLNQTFEGLKWYISRLFITRKASLNQTFEGLKYIGYTFEDLPQNCLNQTFEGLK